MPDCRQIMETLILQAGAIALLGRKRRLQVEQKANRNRDFVSEIDRGIELFLRREINYHFPDHSILGEEMGQRGNNDYLWIIDPIDGTTTYLHGLPHFSISIALSYRQQIILGMVYAPALNELFIAELGGGSWLNSQRLQVNEVAKLAESLWCTGHACLRDNLQPNNLLYMPAIQRHIGDVRVLGSAALDLAFIAAGRSAGFWEIGLNLYDVAAGALLVKEAGGKVSDLYGGDRHYPRSVLASNGHLHSQMIDLFRQIGLPEDGWPPTNR